MKRRKEKKNHSRRRAAERKGPPPGFASSADAAELSLLFKCLEAASGGIQSITVDADQLTRVLEAKAKMEQRIEDAIGILGRRDP